jgi:hypothetical protein
MAFSNRQQPVGGIPFNVRATALAAVINQKHRRCPRSCIGQISLPSQCAMQLRPDPWRRLVLAHWEHLPYPPIPRSDIRRIVYTDIPRIPGPLAMILRLPETPR